MIAGVVITGVVITGVVITGVVITGVVITGVVIAVVVITGVVITGVEIIGVNLELIKRFGIILESINLDRKITLDKFEIYARETRELYIEQYG